MKTAGVLPRFPPMANRGDLRRQMLAKCFELPQWKAPNPRQMMEGYFVRNNLFKIFQEKKEGMWKTLGNTYQREPMIKV